MCFYWLDDLAWVACKDSVALSSPPEHSYKPNGVLRCEIAILPRGCDLCECGDNKEIFTVNIDRGLMQVGRYFVFGLLRW